MWPGTWGLHVHNTSTKRWSKTPVWENAIKRGWHACLQTVARENSGDCMKCALVSQPSYFGFYRSYSQSLGLKSLILSTHVLQNLLPSVFPKQNTIPRRPWSVSVTLQPSSHMHTLQLPDFQTLTPNHRTHPAFCLGGSAWISHLDAVYLAKERSHILSSKHSSGFPPLPLEATNSF